MDPTAKCWVEHVPLRVVCSTWLHVASCTVVLHHLASTQKCIFVVIWTKAGTPVLIAVNACFHDTYIVCIKVQCTLSVSVS